jgi:hypothetical protein
MTRQEALWEIEAIVESGKWGPDTYGSLLDMFAEIKRVFREMDAE